MFDKKTFRNADFEPSVGEYNSVEFGSYLDDLGYVPIDRQVESFFRAGARLVDADDPKNYDSEEDDPVEDPSLRVRDMELSEIGALMGELNQKLTDSARAAAEAQSKLEASKNPQLNQDPDDPGEAKSE